jgi:putative transposase
MNNKVALFRYSVLGSLTSRIDLEHGEIQKLVKDCAEKHYDIPNSVRTQISSRTIERWYYAWHKGGLEGLAPKERSDKGSSQLTDEIKRKVLDLKKENMCRSVNTITALLFDLGFGDLPRSSIHRLLQQNHLSHRVVSDAPSIERRQFEAYKASDIWYSDVMHGPYIEHLGKQVKTYLISYMDDASRLMTHSEFCLNEEAVSVEHVLKEAVMRRGLPKRLVIDNGAAYKSGSLSGICSRLDIKLIFCRPYEPQGKGKLERWHKSVRSQFISELKLKNINNLDDLNDRIHAWIEEVYHRRKHGGLEDETPLDRFRRDIPSTRRLGDLAKDIDEIFYHRIERKVNSVGLIRYNGNHYEVPYQFTRKKVTLVYEPLKKIPKFIEDIKGAYLGEVGKLDKYANLNRDRQRPNEIEENTIEEIDTSLVENALDRHNNRYTLEDK